MSASLQWAIINKFNSKDIRKAGITWSKEAGHLKGKKSFKYSTLVNPGGTFYAFSKISLLLERLLVEHIVSKNS